MLNFGLWLEARWDSELVSRIRGELESTGYCTVWMDLEGRVRTGDPMNDREGRPLGLYLRSMSNKVFLNARERVAGLEMVGDKLKPAQRKLLKFLADNGVIDPSWRLDSGGGVGGYKGWTYGTYTDPELPDTVGGAMGSGLLSPAMDDLVLYHGTTDRGWEGIMRDGGLRPLFSGSNRTVGQESGYKHEMNRGHVYLATRPDKAWFYARQMAESLSARLGERVKPVVLRVKVPDMSRLRTDDDLINGLFNRAARRIWDSLPEGEKSELRARMPKVGGREADDFWAAKYLMGIDEYRRMILGRIGRRAYGAWMASLLRKDQVAYDGAVPLRFLKVVDVPTG